MGEPSVINFPPVTAVKGSKQAYFPAMQTITTLSEVLAFTLGNEGYGIDIQQVQVRYGHEAVTRIDNARDYPRVAVNLRGLAVPIIDMQCGTH